MAIQWQAYRLSHMGWQDVTVGSNLKQMKGLG